MKARNLSFLIVINHCLTWLSMMSNSNTNANVNLFSKNAFERKHDILMSASVEVFRLCGLIPFQNKA